MKELNIKSSTIEKGLELAKEFVNKLISPAIEETGLLISDNIKLLRFRQQIKILLKAKNYVEKNGIKTDVIPMKILVPLLEKCSLEEDEELQNKWATLLANMADSENNLKNQIFPYLLSQISIEEYNALKDLEAVENGHFETAKKLREMRAQDNFSFNAETRKLTEEVNKVNQEGFTIFLDEFEIENLKRLGLVRELPPKILIDELQIENSYDKMDNWYQLEAEYDTDNFGYRLTELGEKFLLITADS
jgi:hypothetical protein